MVSQNSLNEIEKTAKEFFRKMGILDEVKVGKPNELTVPVDLTLEEPQILIGERGQTLSEIQRLLKSILRRKIEEQFYIDLDINGYKKKKVEYLKETARSVADEVALDKKEKTLPPMSAYERRVIHLELAGRADVATQSLGQEPERRVVIKPYP